jgi:hypothetical protein
MQQTAIFPPFLAMILITIFVWFYMYLKRIPFLQRSKVDLNRLTAAELARISPPAVSNPSDNLKNLFELPVIFYALTLYLYATKGVDAPYLTAAWIFVVFRALHSAVQCTINIVIIRFYLYCISALALWFIAFRAAYSMLAR